MFAVVVEVVQVLFVAALPSEVGDRGFADGIDLGVAVHEESGEDVRADLCVAAPEIVEPVDVRKLILRFGDFRLGILRVLRRVDEAAPPGAEGKAVGRDAADDMPGICAHDTASRMMTAFSPPNPEFMHRTRGFSSLRISVET